MKYIVYVNSLSQSVSVNPVADGGDLRDELALRPEVDLFLHTDNGLKLIKSGVPIAMTSALEFTTQPSYRKEGVTPVSVRQAFNVLRARHCGDLDAGWDIVSDFLEKHGA